MNSKAKYVCSVLFLLLLTLVLYQYVDPKVIRPEQHLVYNTQIIDNNHAIDAEHFSSKLPIINISTENTEIPGRRISGLKTEEMTHETIHANMQIFDKDETLHSLSEPSDLQSDIQIRVRGNSSRAFDKSTFLFKFVDESGLEKEENVMNMGKGDSWILHGPYLDKTLMRNYMWYNLSDKIMEWAPDVRFCEVFIDNEYQGVYVMVEQISVGKDRIKLSKYNEQTNVSSYIVSKDRMNINDFAYLNNFSRYTKRIHNSIEIKYPGESKLTPELMQYISEDFSKFEKSLYSYDYQSGAYGYEKFIDVDSFVNYFIINEISQNKDAGVFSTFFYKDITGKLKLSVWDFNNSVNNYIELEHEVEGFFMPHRAWFSMLVKDDKFIEKIIHRYKELRKDILSDQAVTTYIQSVEEYLGVAIDRNFQVWGNSFLLENELLEGEGREISSYDEAIFKYQDRLLERMKWMDENIESLFSYSHESVNKKFNK